MPLQYVSLLNTPYSGSTLVSMLLCSQPGIIGFGDTYVDADPRYYPKHPCTCGAWYDDCPPRVAVRDLVRHGGFPHYDWDKVTPTPVPRSLPWKLQQHWPMTKSAALPFLRAIPHALRNRLYARYYRENSLMLQGLEKVGGYSIYFDGCKDLPRVELLRAMIPDMKLLHVVRHPGAFFYHFHKLGQTGIEKRLDHWIRYNQSAHEFEQLVPTGNYMAVTYESIVQQPEEFVLAMEKFFGMDKMPDRDRTRIHRSQIHIIGNRMRETADRVLDYSNTWRGKMPTSIEEKADTVVSEDSWLTNLFQDNNPFNI